MAAIGVKAGKRPGHRSIVRSWLRHYIRAVVAEARGGVTEARLRAAKVITDDSKVAVRIRGLAELTADTNRSIEERLELLRTQLDDTLTGIFAEHIPGHEPPAGRDDDLIKEVTELLQTPDEDTVYKDLMAFIRKTLSPVIKPLIPCPDHRRPPEEAINALMLDISGVTNEVRHSGLSVAHAIDYMNLLVGWHVREAVASRLSLGALVGLMDTIDEKLQIYSPENPA
jgi:hypothetical protein